MLSQLVGNIFNFGCLENIIFRGSDNARQVAIDWINLTLGNLMKNSSKRPLSLLSIDHLPPCLPGLFVLFSVFCPENIARFDCSRNLPSLLF